MAQHQRTTSPAEQQRPAQRRAFLAHTASLHAVAAWLTRCGITTVALASTGVSWIPLSEWLETPGCEGILVDPGTMPHHGRPQTDVHAGQWLQRLPTLGLLSAAFRPDDPVVVLRSDGRLRLTLLADAARAIPPMPKALTPMHSTRQHVVRDLPGVTGVRILQAIRNGERVSVQLAALRDWRCQEEAATIAHARHGTWRAEHLCALH